MRALLDCCTNCEAGSLGSPYLKVPNCITQRSYPQYACRFDQSRNQKKRRRAQDKRCRASSVSDDESAAALAGRNLSSLLTAVETTRSLSWPGEGATCKWSFASRMYGVPSTPAEHGSTDHADFSATQGGKHFPGRCRLERPESPLGNSHHETDWGSRCTSFRRFATLHPRSLAQGVDRSAAPPRTGRHPSTPTQRGVSTGNARLLHEPRSGTEGRSRQPGGASRTLAT